MYAPYNQLTGSWVFTEGSGCPAVLVASCANEVVTRSATKTMATDLRAVSITSQRETCKGKHRIRIQYPALAAHLERSS